MSVEPYHSVLYSSILRNSPQPWSRIALFKPDFALMFFPGFSFVPRADALMPFTPRSSTTIARLVFASSVVAL